MVSKLQPSKNCHYFGWRPFWKVDKNHVFHARIPWGFFGVDTGTIRNLKLLESVCLQFCLGSPYIWAILTRLLLPSIVMRMPVLFTYYEYACIRIFLWGSFYNQGNFCQPWNTETLIHRMFMLSCKQYVHSSAHVLLFFFKIFHHYCACDIIEANMAYIQIFVHPVTTIMSHVCTCLESRSYK